MTQCGQYIDSRKFLSAERSAIEFSTARWHAKVKATGTKEKKMSFCYNPISNYT